MEMNYNVGYKLSLYKELTVINESDKSKIELVQNIVDNKIYVKKTLSNYKIEVFKELQNIDNIGIPKVYEVIEDEGILYVIEEFINGKTLEEIQGEGVLSEDRVIEYGIKICEILDVLHNLSSPIIHRDIKPSNIIVDNNGIVKLIDFDVSRIHKSNENRDTQILGTEGYASPEQFGFNQTDSRSDIYSIGVLMNVLTTGKLPRDKKNDEKLAKVIEKCIKISPNERYKTCLELKEDLELCSGKQIKYRKSKMFIRNLPGFRRGKPSYILAASLWYIFLVLAIFIDIGTKSFSYIIGDISMVIALLGLTFLYGNYNNIQSMLPLLKGNNKSMRKVGFTIYTILIIIFAGMMLNIFQ